MLDVSSEITQFAESVSGSLESCWPDATSAPTADMHKVAGIGVEQGWMGLAGMGAVEALGAAMAELGRRACPLPLHDAYAASLLLGEEWAEQIESGDVVPVMWWSPIPGDSLGPVDDGGIATHVVAVDTEGSGVHVYPVIGHELLPSLAVPAWNRITVGPAVHSGPLTETTLPAIVTTYSLALSIRALAAAHRGHELSIEHAKVRRQFGRTIGSFGAVQQRVAAAEIEATAARSLIQDALAAVAGDHDDAVLASALAVRFITDGVRQIMFDAQHTLGAIGYFEEHEAAWLFRRVQSDVQLLKSLPTQGAAVDTLLIEGGRGLPNMKFGDEAEQFRADVRHLLNTHRDPSGRIDSESLRVAAAEEGLFAMRWPEEHRGRPASMEQMAVLTEEMKRAGGPVDRAMSAATMLGHSILRHGTQEQQSEFLPLIREGRLAFCLGYSEPEAGSDLASLRTRAIRDGDDWVIDGQKLWTTRGNTATHVWLAVRTDPDASPRHAGITIFMIPMDTPGITVSDHVALSGEISCTVFYDSVRVPDSARIGEVNGGWRVITDALSSERLIMGGVAGSLLRQFDVLVDELRARGFVDALTRDALALNAARLQAARSLVVAGMLAADDAEARRLSPMAAVLSGELAESFGQSCIDMLGPTAALEGAESPGEGLFDAALRLAPMYVIGGGTNDIQRGLIARGLGLARE